MSALTLKNDTAAIARFTVRVGDQVLASPTRLAPGSGVAVPTNRAAQAVVAWDGNVYAAEPIQGDAACTFVARILAKDGQQTSVFHLFVEPSPAANQWTFKNATADAVKFVVSIGEVPVRQVVVPASSPPGTLALEGSFVIEADVDGVAAGPVTTDNANATVTVELDGTSPEPRYRLVVS